MLFKSLLMGMSWDRRSEDFGGAQRVTATAPARKPFAAKRLLQVLHASGPILSPDEKRRRKNSAGPPSF
jgi:hypothetical protein